MKTEPMPAPPAAAPAARPVTFRVRVSPSMARWLRALAKEQSKQKDFNGDPVTAKTSVAELLETAAEALVHSAGRRTGSWEAEAGRRLLEGNGYIPEVYDRCKLAAADEAEEAKWRETRAALDASRPAA